MTLSKSVTQISASFLTLLAAFLVTVAPVAKAQAQVSTDLQTDISEITDDVAKWLGMESPRRKPTQVNSKLWRSGQPTPATLTALYARGVRIIIDLEDRMDDVAKEKAIAQKMGFLFYSYPINSILGPSDEDMSQILEIIQTAKVPVLVHCRHGEDRTGLTVGLVRVFLENWPAAKAYDEMLKYGYHPILLGLDMYFRSKVGAF